MSGDGSNEDADVKGHDGEHDNVRETHAQCVDGSLGEATTEAGGGPGMPATGGPEAAGDVGEEFDGGGDEEDEEEGEDVVASPGAVAGPTGEEYLDVLPPEEGHVHPVTHIHVHVPIHAHPAVRVLHSRLLGWKQEKRSLLGRRGQGTKG